MEASRLEYQIHLPNKLTRSHLVRWFYIAKTMRFRTMINRGLITITKTQFAPQCVDRLHFLQIIHLPTLHLLLVIAGSTLLPNNTASQ